MNQTLLEQKEQDEWSKLEAQKLEEW